MSSDRSGYEIERILHLRKAPSLGSLPFHDLAAVAEPARERFFPAGKLLLRDGEPIPALYVIVEGRIRVTRGGRAFGVLGPGAGIGTLGILARDPEGIRAVAETDATVLELDSDAFLELLEDHFSILRHVLREFCRDSIDIWSRVPESPLLPSSPSVTGSPTRPLDFVERILLLRQGAFARSSVNALSELSRGLTELRFEAGTSLWTEGEPSGTILLGIDGVVRCSSVRRNFAFRSGSAQAVGALEALAEVPHWYDAVAETPFVALSGHVDGLLDVFEDNFEMALDFLGMISRWRMRLLDRLTEQGEDPLQHFYRDSRGAAPGPP
jgi:CRP-like cAMP-binding protein